MNNRQKNKKLSEMWDQILAEVGDQNNFEGRKTKLFKINNEHLFRLSCIFPKRELQLLLETDSKRAKNFYKFPRWEGMKFDIIKTNLPGEGTNRHFCLKLEKKEHKEVFLAVCTDLAEVLEKEPSRNREEIFIEFLNRWTNFFTNFGNKRLSLLRQQGLFGELWWIKLMLEKNIPALETLSSWKGCERSYQDFDFEGHVVEVKTTMTKEPRKVTINNERQLNPEGLNSLHLLVLSIIRSAQGGQSLPEIVESINSKFEELPGCYIKFNQCLQKAGYLQNHADDYKDTFTVSKNELFEVKDDFPRITNFPDGIGDIKYSLTVSVLKNFLIKTEKYFSERI